MAFHRVSWCLAGGALVAHALGGGEGGGRRAAREAADRPAPASAPAPGADAGRGGASTSAPAPVCPEGMALVDASACPGAEQTCERWLDPPPYQRLRCASYRPSICRGPRVPMRFCIDVHERTEEGTRLPRVDVSFTAARAACAEAGQRLCREDEWQLACEGEDALPYPYGLVRDATACNIDQTHLGRPEQGLRDLRVPVDAMPRCTSPFGVRHLTGNADEWTEDPKAPPGARSVLRGGWWLPGRNRCRARTTGHGEIYQGKQVGFRCCADAT